MPVVARSAPITASELNGTNVPARNDAMAMPQYPYSMKNWFSESIYIMLLCSAGQLNQLCVRSVMNDEMLLYVSWHTVPLCSKTVMMASTSITIM